MLTEINQNKVGKLLLMEIAIFYRSNLFFRDAYLRLHLIYCSVTMVGEVTVSTVD